MSEYFDLIVIGGGAAGFFAAITAKMTNPDISVIILEKTNQLLSKVRISGGGRCNVTHSCFEPVLLTKNYPRGNKALLGPFTKFQPLDTMEWFQSRGVALKTESDGRMFPTTDDSQTIINCLMAEAQKLEVVIRKQQHITHVSKSENQTFELTLSTDVKLTCSKLILATGSNSQGHTFAKELGHSIQNPVPSLFTFNIPTSALTDLSGIAVPKATVTIKESPFTQTGPLLITHWGFSGPAILKLSAWAARFLYDKKYCADISINWLSETTFDQAMALLSAARKNNPNRTIISCNPFTLPKNLWKRFLELLEIPEGQLLSGMGNDLFKRLAAKVTSDIYSVNGKTTHKEEFVTCGGITLDEVNFKTMESRRCPNLYLVGEVLDIDGVTGGFNFQNAWTSGWLAGNAAS